MSNIMLGSIPLLSQGGGVTLTNIYNGTTTLTEPIQEGVLYLIEYEIKHSDGVNSIVVIDSRLISGGTKILGFGNVRESGSSSTHYWTGITLSLTKNSKSISYKRYDADYVTPYFNKITAIYKIY